MKQTTCRNMKIVSLLGLSLLLSHSVLADKGAHKEKPKPPTFSELDYNQNGEVSFEEFSQHPIPHGDPQTIFNRIDTDGSGVISKQELKDHKPPRMNKRGKHSAQEDE